MIINYYNFNFILDISGYGIIRRKEKEVFVSDAQLVRIHVCVPHRLRYAIRTSHDSVKIKC